MLAWPDYLVRSKNSSAAPSPFTLPPDGNNARVRSVARGVERARRGRCSYPEGTAGKIDLYAVEHGTPVTQVFLDKVAELINASTKVAFALALAAAVIFVGQVLSEVAFHITASGGIFRIKLSRMAA